nr:hypothetical protein [Tanacetum cinerariifolium]
MEDAKPINAHDSSIGEHNTKTGGFMLDVLENMIKVGNSMGFTMEGCMNDMERIIESQGARDGYSFTWSHPSAKKISKLDCFFVSDGLISIFPHMSAVCLDRNLSDHRPILLQEVVVDYGPSPFRVFHSWFCYEGFDQMIVETWNGITLDDSNLLVRFKKKLQILKKEIWIWVKAYKQQQYGCSLDIRSKLHEIDIELDKGGSNDDVLLERMDLLKKLNDIHSPSPNRCKLNFVFPNKLSLDLASDLERLITRAEVRSAVWGCGENKSPRPDGFTFEFFRKYWDILEADFCAAID